jgi:hypothetical protein
MATQSNNLVLLENGFTRTIDTANDSLSVGVNFTIASSKNLTVTGNLIVEGTTFTNSSETVLFTDNHLYLNNAYTTVSAQTGGLVINYLPTATNDTVAATGFVAGVAATSNPTVITAGSATFSAGHIIQISGASNVSNNGLFEVLTHVTTTLTIRGIGTTATVEDFTQNQFVTDTTVAGAIRRVNVSILRAGTDGIWETGSGASTGITFADLASATGTTLQQAYVNGNTITVTSGEGPLAITLTSDDFTVNGANDVDFGGTTPVSTFNVDSAGVITVDGTGVSIDGTSTSNFSTTAAGLTISTITSGTLAVTSAGALNLSSTTGDWQASGAVTIDSSGGSISIGGDADAFAINVGTGAAARTITVGNSTGATSVVVNSGTGAINIGTNAVAHTVTVGTTTGAGATTLQTGTGAMTFTAGGVFDVNATTNVTIDSTGGQINIGTGADSFNVSIGTAGERNVSIGSSTATSGILITAGTGGIGIGNNAVAMVIDIGNATGASEINIHAGTGGIDIGTTAQARTTNIATGAAAQTVTVGSTSGASSMTIAAGTGTINIGASASVRTVNVGTGAAAQTVVVGSTNGASSTTIDSGTGNIDIGNSASARVVNLGTGAAAQTVTLGSTNSTSSMTIDSGTGTINIGTSASARTVNVGTGAAAETVVIGSTNTTSALTLQSGTGKSTLTTTSTAVDGITLMAGGTTFLQIDNRAVAAGTPGQRVALAQFANFSTNGAGFAANAGEALAVGDVVTIKQGVSSNQIFKADANGTDLKSVTGIAMQTAGASGDSTKINTISGTLIAVKFAAAPAGTDNGKPVYLSETAGQATITAPSASGSVVFRVGTLQGADGASTTPAVVFFPQFIANIP